MKTILVVNPKGGTGKTITSITLAGALANLGRRVALADADVQKSSFNWLKRRNLGNPPIKRRDWTNARELGTAPKTAEYLIVDAPGSIDPADAADLVKMADLILVPLTASWIDEDATKRFLKSLRDLKRIRKGKARIEVIANRLRSFSRSRRDLMRFCNSMEQPPLACISDRTIYGDLARQGLSVFDRTQKPFRVMQDQWKPVLDVILAKAS
ncbi:ParA family protein [Phaeobacter sp. J2-8]|uniref:ParA family protein n=1 Tax=Phaeobacter sp. J2-8 TaxID=2931394 RepID=UPI001FD37D1F|nr:ParA family protein [Phaeobacter sp. J2-8]MCJ7872353.1 ParA family protein [Phaeobacter sp. J2-8]